MTRGRIDRFRNVGVALVAAVAMIAGCSDSDEGVGSGKANVRVIHASYDAPAVDILIDGTKAISSLEYGKASGYASIDSGARQIQVQASAGGSAVIDASLDFPQDTDWTVYAVNMLSGIEAIASRDDRTPNPAKAKIRFIHGSPDAPAVDIKLDTGDGAAVFSNVAFKGITQYAEVDAGTYNFVVTAAGDTSAVVSFEGQALEAGQVYTVIAIGTLDASDAADFTARVWIDSGAGDASLDLKAKSDGPKKAKIRVVHGSYDAPAVDVALDGSTAITALSYGESSGYAEVDAGERQVTVSAAGGGQTVINAQVTLMADKEYSVFALDMLSNIGPLVVEDNRTADPNKARVRLLHASPDAPAVDLKLNAGDGPAVFQNIAFKTMTEYTAVDEGEYSFVITGAGSTSAVISYQAIKLEKGKTYTVLALGTLDANDNFPFIARAFVDDGDGKASVDLVAKITGTANVKVVHASPDAPGVDLLLDNAKLNSAPLTFPNNTGYLQLDAGQRNVKVQASANSATVINADVTLMDKMNYTIFAVNTLSNIEPLVLTDDLTAPAAGKAHVRFVHLSPDAPAVDIFVKGSAQALFPNQAFKDATAFTPVDAGTVDLEVRAGGSVVLTVPNVTLADGKIYTIFANGLLAAGAANPLSASIIVNN
jgi:hypothetical protein